MATIINKFGKKKVAVCLLTVVAIVGLIVVAISVTACATAKADNSTPSGREVIIGRYNNQQLTAKYGEPGEFIPNSTLAKLEERKTATGLYDAVTYDITEDFVSWFNAQLLRNPVYGDGARQALQEAGIIGTAAWVQKFAADCDKNYASGYTYEPWLNYTDDGKIFVTKDYHLTAARLAEIFKGANYLGIQSG